MLREEERQQASIYMNLCKEEKAFYKQRSRVQWLTLHDHNTRFFHRSLIHRNARNGINRLEDADGVVHTGNLKMGDITVKYYRALLQTNQQPCEGNVANLYPKVITKEDKDTMKLPVSDKEIKDALFSIPDDKAPGHDGYTSLFFKKAWPTIGVDFTGAVKSFFCNSRLPHCVNSMRIVLIPKKESPNCLDDYRPISCSCGNQSCSNHMAIRMANNYWSAMQREGALYNQCGSRQAWEWAVASYGTGHHVKNHILGMVLAATVYHIWRECNRRFHNHHYSSIQKMKGDVIHMVRNRLANIGDRDELLESIRHQRNIQ
ncbi:hypothetical protein SADUNF_Sadunf19G0058000 [Salix dunnii]|uniref:Uncharacterized protein n=1 Tax=Salix dunnii TaxID=1413687 RepID=A0A835MHR2_9ROSI|nr:hypothetical protein SADUNF_Sadunf19G0058000 [Salix dunnii]